MNVPSSGSQAEQAGAIALASNVHLLWDQAWPSVAQSIQSQGLEITCREGCHGCCFNLKPCHHCEGLLIDEYLRTEFPAERQEHFRSRVEGAVGNLRKRRRQGFCDSADELERSGGIECPFLERGRCAIYPVRPLACRSMVFATSKEALHSGDAALCRKCPASVACLEAQIQRMELQDCFEGPGILSSSATTISRTRDASIPELLSRLWEREIAEPSTDLMTSASWKSRLESRGGWFDQTWHDDGFDWEVMKFPVVLPEEGEYPPDLVVLSVRPEVHEVYGESVRANLPVEFRVLYKKLPGGRFNWKRRAFEGTANAESHIVWMGDSIQERLMMWEAAKRCDGHVLCGGLGMGIFPQFALSLPQVRSVHVVEVDPAVISLMETRWAKQSWPRRGGCSISSSSIEDFLKHTDEKFDTVYIDTWDALTYDYLPHVNYLKELARRTLRPGGEILLWGYDLMVGFALDQARYIWDRREEFLAADEEQLKILERQQPLFHKMLRWFLRHDACAREELLTETYRLATTWQKDLGRLSLDRIG